ncbi:PAS domain S-box-containing protein/diguanylate cyclase (GGDEF)-like protein [Acidovorax sp. 69]|uniref:EAL domain-containing protein n=1 Tax=Acidovorax sp. 69 TaxID=2035202 RepID=UPI000C24D352|nr:EAL domain-containing protein [Acidovorax sp. 69]PJI98721.1 PAS domain S-box-containing protein/diguanylate cyclase (GGDEF)-like protein [Acidovorax sp. 69]
MSSPHSLQPGRPLLSDAPAVTVVLVVAVLVLVILPLAQMLGDGAGAQYGLEPFLELVAVLLGLLVVSVSLHALEAQEQARANVLVAGFGVAAACNFLHGVLVHSGAGGSLLSSTDISLWLSRGARVAEAVTLGLTAARLSAPGAARAWLVVAGAITLVLVGSALGPLPGWFAHAADGVLPQVVAAGLAVVLGVSAVVLYRSAHRRDPQPRELLFAWAAVVFACGELTLVLLGRNTFVGGPLAHGLRVIAYALLYQAVFDAGIRRPFARIQEAESRLRESESRLSLLGRNLPHSVLFQVVRELDGRVHFVHMGDAIERLNGVSAEEVQNDPGVLYRQILEEDINGLRQAERQSFLSMTSLETVFRLRRTDGQVRWMHLSSSPRMLQDGRVLWDGVQTDITVHHEAEEAAHAKDALMANMLRHVPGGVARLDRDLRVLYVNEQQARWLYKRPQDLQGQRLQDVIAPEVFARMQPHFDKAFAGETAVFENRIDGPDGMQYRHTTIALETVAGEDTPAVVLFSYDLTALKRIEQELAHQKAHLASVVSAIPDMVFLKDAEGVYLSVNPVFERFVGRPEQQILGRNDYDLTTPAEADRFRKYDQRAMHAWQPLVYEETLTFAEDGYQGRFETIKTPIRDLHGRVTGVLGVCRDITDRKRAEQEIERLAFYDALTGLPNRRLLLDRLQRSIAACQRTKNLGALLFIDLDNFKDLNDTLGHDMGDQLLAQVATRLVGSVREADTVARFGGDEFVVMLEALAPDLQEAATQAETVAEKLLASLNQPFDLDGGQHYSTPSIGITLFGDERLTVDELLKRADLAMYQAKAAGRNTQRFFDPDMQAAVNARSNLEADLRQGLARGELLVHYQPVVDHHARLMGAEALVRWLHPQRGMISPGDFIPLAEQTGLILPLGQYVLQTACEQLQRWSQHETTAHLSISVNVSARQFRQAGFVAQVLQTLKSHNADPRKLKLELTESLLLGDIEDTIARMVQLKSEGVGFALDDFGTGYSSLSYLKRLPLDQVKIDQSFVRDVLTDPNDAAIVRTILALAKSLDLEVVAEGVETTGQLSFLRLHGCEGFQGYLFGRPVPMDVFVREHQLGLMAQPVATVPEGRKP